jgi:aminopeptidase-like protein
MKYNPYFINGSGEDDKMHIKTEKCKPCIYKDSCPGIAITYKEVYGDGELKPLLD